MGLWTRRYFLMVSFAVAGAGVSAGCRAPADASPSPRIPRIGFLSLGGQTAGGFVDNCRAGLADLGYVEAQHYTVEARYAEGDAERLPALAAELVALAPDVVVAAGTLPIVAARTASGTTPIVMSNLGDPVGGHLVTSLARPGANITGVSGMAVELSGKRLQLLRDAVPGTTRVAAIWRPPDESMAAETGETRVAGQRLGVEVQPMEARTADDFDRAYAAARAAHLDGVVVVAEPLMAGNRRRLVELALQHRLPTISSDAEYAAAGGLMSYGPNAPAQQRRTAYYVDKILKGAKPADLPIEQPTAFDLVINLATAQALGLSIPQPVLQQATQVIQ